MFKKRAIVLSSGGLDSILAMKILEKEGIEVIGVHFVTWFNLPKYALFEDMPGYIERYGIKVYNVDISDKYTNILLYPEYGYGSSVNPCIDCKILFFSRAKELMKEFNADFVASGEVIGQRPMTQNINSMRLIEKKSGLEGLLLRPLSAKLLNPTIPEEKGWVNRDNLLDISGRGRRRQMELAEKFGIKDYPSPAGGCILTEKNFAPRFYDLVKHVEMPEVMDFLILRYGRQFRLPDGSKLVIGKNKRENDFLKRLKWGNYHIDFIDIPGPYCLFDWHGSIESFRIALNLCVKYSDYRFDESGEKASVKIIKKNKIYKVLKFTPSRLDVVKELMIT